MIYGYGLWQKVFLYLLKELPHGKIRNISDFNKIKQFAEQSDLIFFLRFGKGSMKLLSEFKSQGILTYPNPEFSLFISNRNIYLKELNEFTKYPLKRAYAENIYDYKTVPRLSEKVVMKIGDFHCGEHKYLLSGGQPIPVIKHKLRKENVVFEEFVPDARSIRIGFVGSPLNEENLYICEHINSFSASLNHETSWIKNIDPIETTYLYEERSNLNFPDIDDLIEESKRIALHYNSDLIGIDWVINKNKTAILELNDMIGIPDDERVINMFQNHALNICQNYLTKYEEK